MFHDEFSSFRRYDPATKQGVWDTTFSWGRSNPGAKDASLYVDPSFRLPDGSDPDLNPFTITKDGLDITASPAPAAIRAAYPTLKYVSGVMTTRHSFAQTYGYFEASMKLPAGQGLWPAFWLLPESYYSYEKTNPEIDIMEVLEQAPWRVYQTTHSPAGIQQQIVRTDIDSSTDFHRYGIAWNAGAITFYIDGRPSGTVPNVSDRKMFPVLNLQVGAPGSWGGIPYPSTVFPSHMIVKDVRVYQERGRCT